MTQTDGLIDHVLELEESILWKWLYYPKQSTDSMQSLSNYNGVFYRTKTENFTICMKKQKTTNSQRNIEKKKKRSWMNQVSWLQSIQQSYSNQDIIVLAQKQKYRPMEHVRKYGDKPMHI